MPYQKIYVGVREGFGERFLSLLIVLLLHWNW